MKRILLLLVVSFLIGKSALACGPFDRYYLAKDYFTFRACGDNMSGNNQWGYLNNLRKKANCEAWSQMTSADIPLEDVEQVVYKWSIDDLQKMQKAVSGHSSYQTANRFAQWLVKHQDVEVLDFLIVAKTCEQVREEQYSEWYYPVKGDNCDVQLSAVIQKAKAYDGPRLKDRYDLQAIRAYFARRDYEGCIAYWKSDCLDDRTKFLKEMCAEYVAGSYIRLGKPDEAEKLYRSQGLAYTASLPLKDDDRRFSFIYHIAPDDAWLITEIQKRIHEQEWHLGHEEYLEDARKEFRKLHQMVTRICREGKCKDMSKWYYTRAYLADQLGRSDEAWQYILQAEQTAVEQDLKDAVHVLKILCTVKRTERYDVAFENRFFNELVWLDDMIVKHLDKKSHQKILEEGVDNHICGYSQYYWSDMMRKIVIAHVVPLCLASDFKTRALQYLNMADNRLFRLVGKQKVYVWDDNYNAHEELLTWDEYRMSTQYENHYDYRNDFFINLDSLGVQYVQRLSYRMQHPQSELDHFLNSRSYTDLQFLYDIIGTQLIAARRYGEAATYLGKISAQFNRSRNVFKDCDFDPFTLQQNRQPDVFYKLHFAQAMQVLQDSIVHCRDLNQRAEWMLEYARGLKNSIEYRCWPLTSFYWGRFYRYPLFSAYQRRLKAGIEREYVGLKKKAFRMFTDPERAAKAYYDWALFKTAVRNCPKTKTADFIRGHCDELKDYGM